MLRKRSALTHGGSVAPCSCALSCAHGKTGVGHRAQPARGLPRAHAAGTPAPPTHPAFDSFLSPSHTTGRSREKAEAKATATAVGWRPRLCERSDPLLLLLVISRGGSATGICLGPGGWGWRGIRAMDGAAKPPGMDSRRPRQSHPPGPPAGSQLSATNPTHHGGAPPFADPRRRRASRAATCPRADLRHHGHPAPARTAPCSSTCS